MGNAQRKDPWITPQACLRLKFWQMVNPVGRDGVHTPFEDLRIDSGLSRTEIGQLMGLTSSDYANFESGETHAHPRDIIAFCKVVNCHPLDLYKEAGPKTALPEEMFYTLIQTMEDSSLDEAAKQKSWTRLEQEADRARAMIAAYWSNLKPLFLSLGYPTGPKATHIPVLVRAPGARSVMDRAMIEYELLHEEQLDTFEKELAENQQSYVRNHRQLMLKAAKIYGENAALAITGLDTMLQMTGKTDKLKIQLKSRPDMISPLKDGVTPDPNDVGWFFERVKRHQKLVSKNTELKTAVETTSQKLENFTKWRDTPQTFALLDWYEHYSVVKGIGEKMTRAPKHSGPATPAL